MKAPLPKAMSLIASGKCRRQGSDACRRRKRKDCWQSCARGRFLFTQPTSSDTTQELGRNIRWQPAAIAPIIESLPSIRPLLAQYPFNSLRNWHFEILFIVAIIIQLIHIVLEAL